MEREGKLPAGTARRWAHESKDQGVNLKELPEKVKDKKLEKVAEAFITKMATLGTNTSTAMTGVKNAKPDAGKIKTPRRQVIGTARGFDPAASVNNNGPASNPTKL